MIILPIPQPPISSAQSQHPRPGAGVMMGTNAFGFWFSAPRNGSSFNHPWRPSLFGKNVTFLAGTVRSVNGIGPITPTILSGGSQVPMVSGNVAAPLTLDPSIQNDAGECWVVLEVTPDPATGELLQGALCQLKQFVPPAGNNFNDGTTTTVGRTPIAQFLWNGNNVTLAQEIAMFDLVYQRIMPGPGGGKVAHFFL
jgi:hypothetical protein